MADEAEVDPTCSCAICMEVLVDPVTLPCGHALDLACAQRVVNASRGGAASCPTCREPIPAVLPNISVQLRDLVARLYPKQVAERRAEGKKAAHVELETAISTEDVEELRSSAETSWQREGDVERLRARVVDTWEAILKRAQRMLERTRSMPDPAVLQKAGLEAVSVASRDALCAMMVQAAAQQGVDVNTRAAGEPAADEDPPERLLRVAAKQGLAETVVALVKAGAEVSHVDNQGRTALSAAAGKGHVSVIQALVEAGADVNLINVWGVTSLYVAAQEGQVAAIQALLEAKAQVDLCGSKGFTPLLRAARMGHVEVINALVQAGAHVNHASREGVSALHAAAMEGHVDAIKALIQAGADLHKVGSSGRTPLAAARAANHDAAAAALVEAGAKQ